MINILFNFLFLIYIKINLTNINNIINNNIYKKNCKKTIYIFNIIILYKLIKIFFIKIKFKNYKIEKITILIYLKKLLFKK